MTQTTTTANNSNDNNNANGNNDSVNNVPYYIPDLSVVTLFFCFSR